MKSVHHHDKTSTATTTPKRKENNLEATASMPDAVTSCWREILHGHQSRETTDDHDGPHVYKCM